MTRGIPIPPDLREEIIAAVRDGADPAKLAAAHGVKRSTVEGWARDGGPRFKGTISAGGETLFDHGSNGRLPACSFAGCDQAGVWWRADNRRRAVERLRVCAAHREAELPPLEGRRGDPLAQLLLIAADAPTLAEAARALGVSVPEVREVATASPALAVLAGRIRVIPSAVQGEADLTSRPAASSPSASEPLGVGAAASLPDGPAGVEAGELAGGDEADDLDLDDDDDDPFWDDDEDDDEEPAPEPEEAPVPKKKTPKKLNADDLAALIREHPGSTANELAAFAGLASGRQLGPLFAHVVRRGLAVKGDQGRWLPARGEERPAPGSESAARRAAETDGLVMAALGGCELSQREISEQTGVSTRTIRASIARLGGQVLMRRKGLEKVYRLAVESPDARARAERLYDLALCPPEVDGAAPPSEWPAATLHPLAARVLDVLEELASDVDPLLEYGIDITDHHATLPLDAAITAWAREGCPVGAEIGAPPDRSYDAGLDAARAALAEALHYEPVSAAPATLDELIAVAGSLATEAADRAEVMADAARVLDDAGVAADGRDLATRIYALAAQVEDAEAEVGRTVRERDEALRIAGEATQRADRLRSAARTIDHDRRDAARLLLRGGLATDDHELAIGLALRALEGR